MSAVGIIGFICAAGALLATLLPFSPLTIDLVNLTRERQIFIHQRRKQFWGFAAICSIVALVSALVAVRNGQPHLLYAMVAFSAMTAMMFWTGYVPIVMAPPGAAEHLPGDAAAKVIDDDEVILAVSVGYVAVAYRRDQIARPHYFHDQVGERDLMISYCILCNSATAFEPVLNGTPLSLECVTAYNNNIIYYDAPSGNYIQQLSAEVIAGPALGQNLKMYPVVMARWEDWLTLYPQTTLYDSPPREFRDRLVALMLQLMIPISRLSGRTAPWHRVRGAIDKRLPAMAFVVGVDIKGEAVGYPLKQDTADGVINDQVGGDSIVVMRDREHDVAAVFSRQVAGQLLEFDAVEAGPGIAADRGTGTRWDATGLAVEGSLAGERLDAVPHFNKLFWFSWALFKPSTRLYAAA